MSGGTGPGFWRRAFTSGRSVPNRRYRWERILPVTEKESHYRGSTPNDHHGRCGPGYLLETGERLIPTDPEKIRTQVEACEREALQEFDLDVEFPGGFTGEVMGAMAAIPYGGTRTYGEIAEAIDGSVVSIG